MTYDKKIKLILQLANEHLDNGRLQEALYICDKALSKKPNHLECTELRLQILIELQETQQALSCAQYLVKTHPRRIIGWTLLGQILLHRGKNDDAEQALRKALQLDNSHAKTWCILGQVFRKKRQRGQAVSCIQRAYQLDQNNAEILTNLGLLQYDLGHFKAAVHTQQVALNLAPNQVPILINLGNALRANGLLQEALRHYDQALRLDPTAPGIEWNRAVTLLLSGEYQTGFTALEGRFSQHGRIVPEWLATAWDGSDLGGGVLLIEAEQGFGDLLQFARFFALAAKRNAKVILRCHPRMRQLMLRISGLDDVYSNQQLPPIYDARIALFSLPRVLQLSSPSITEGSYVTVDPVQLNKWREKLHAKTFTIGIAWQGNPSYEEDHHRSIALKHYQPLLENPAVVIYSLQKFHGIEQLQDLAADVRPIDLGSQLDTGHHAFEDTAAVISQLDLVISSDTSIVHLAGALGVPTWVMLPYAPDWRWGLASDRTAWYTTMRLFRQQTPGDWTQVIEQVCSALTLLLREKEQP